jgi:hypothetical protein
LKTQATTPTKTRIASPNRQLKRLTNLLSDQASAMQAARVRLGVEELVDAVLHAEAAAQI